MLGKIIAIIFSLIFITIIAGGVMVGAANAAAPGDLLYGLDRGLETIQLNLTFNAESAAKLQEQLAEERLQELADLADRGDTAGVEAALEAVPPELAPGPAVEFNVSADVVSAGDQAAAAGEGDDLTPYCEETAEKNHPVGEKLASQLGVPYEEIMDWACAGYGFGDINHAYSVSLAAEVPVEEVFAKFDELQDWGEVRNFYGLSKSGKENPEGGEQGGGEGGERGYYCSEGAEKQHPAGLKLANQYGVEYEEIMDWFCQGYGFGEIKLAYHISQITGVPVEEVFDMRANGAGWGEIMKTYDVKGKAEKVKNEKAKGKGKPTPKPKKEK